MKKRIEKINIYNFPLDLRLHFDWDLNKEEKLDVTYWWKKSSPEFSNKVFNKRTKDLNLETVVFILNETEDVLIFCSIVGVDTVLPRNVKIISKENIKQRESLKTCKETPKVGDRVLVKFEDTVTNYNIGSIEEILKNVKYDKPSVVGYLMSNPDEDVTMVSLVKNIDLNEYKYVMAIPKEVVKDISVLTN